MPFVLEPGAGETLAPGLELAAQRGRDLLAGRDVDLALALLVLGFEAGIAAQRDPRDRDLALQVVDGPSGEHHEAHPGHGGDALQRAPRPGRQLGLAGV